MGTDKTDPLKQETKSPSYPCWSCHPWSKMFKTQFVHVRCTPIVVKILSTGMRKKLSSDDC
jgi:hypothetical protein